MTKTIIEAFDDRIEFRISSDSKKEFYNALARLGEDASDILRRQVKKWTKKANKSFQ